MCIFFSGVNVWTTIGVFISAVWVKWLIVVLGLWFTETEVYGSHYGTSIGIHCSGLYTNIWMKKTSIPPPACKHSYSTYTTLISYTTVVSWSNAHFCYLFLLILPIPTLVNNHHHHHHHLHHPLWNIVSLNPSEVTMNHLTCHMENIKLQIYNLIHALATGTLHII